MTRVNPLSTYCTSVGIVGGQRDLSGYSISKVEFLVHHATKCIFLTCKIPFVGKYASLLSVFCQQVTFTNNAQ